MNFNHIHFIINPAAGREEPILSYINQAFENSNVDWDVSVVKKDKSPGKIARTLIGKTDLIAVYGGDGCATDVAGVLIGTGTPMAILPAGTANVLAKELGLPLKTQNALELLASGKMTLKTIDSGLVNGYPFMLRVNLGIMADMILHADRQLKNNIGQLAYGASAIIAMSEAQPVSYQLEIDGKTMTETGVSLTVTNSGHIGVGDFSLQPGISITDGLLDVILLKDNSFISLLKATGGTLLHLESDAFKHWQCKQVVISLEAETTFICDDYPQTAKKLAITVVPASVLVAVPDEIS